jgi:hypothetical protein
MWKNEGKKIKGSRNGMTEMAKLFQREEGGRKGERNDSRKYK